jgi:hypothetical protein
MKICLARQPGVVVGERHGVQINVALGMVLGKHREHDGIVKPTSVS